MSTNATPFEAPAGSPLDPIPASPGRASEPQLAIDQIQGNIFPGFNKDHQTLLFLRIDNPTNFAAWLGDMSDRVATTGDVLSFNRLFKSLRRKHHGETAAVQAVWMNMAFSFAGLKMLEQPGMNLDDFVDEAFTKGLLDRAVSGELGDPVGSGTAGDPGNWVVGGDKREPHVVLLFAADDRHDLNEAVASTVRSLFPSVDAGGKVVSSGATLLFRQDGDTLTGPLAGHEHFGFKDGISQPGVRGLLPDGSPLTPSQNALNPGQGKPGQDLLWPGEFVFGYPGQDPKKEIDEPGKDPLKNKERKAPEFARNGSFLVFRRLRQDVGGFHRFLGQLASQFGVAPAFVGARMVGRWPSGAAVVISPAVDDPEQASDDCKNNNFEFAKEKEEDDKKPPRPVALPGEVCENVTPPEHDPDGQKLPFAGHIRKAYPRNDQSSTIPSLNESTTQTHRLLRRGIPYGPQSASSLCAPMDDGVDRGLLFLAYQVSIVDQFEFVTKNWVNNADFKEDGTGFDPIIGQNSADPTRRRAFKLGLPGETAPIETDQDWVVPTGGGYFFAPSIAGLKALASVKPPAKSVAGSIKKSRTHKRNK
ncbi:MAG: Dyp-type peroxidase [Planctomycetia bacterium]|nr:Dyp-type peroxidase [Planctomycetia bacterium]